MSTSNNQSKRKPLRISAITPKNDSDTNNTEKIYQAIAAKSKHGVRPAMIYRFESENKEDMCYSFQCVKSIAKVKVYSCSSCWAKGKCTFVNLINNNFTTDPAALDHICEPVSFISEMERRASFKVRQKWRPMFGINTLKTPKESGSPKTAVSDVDEFENSTSDKPVVDQNEEEIDKFLEQCFTMEESIGDLYQFTHNGVKGVYRRSTLITGPDWAKECATNSRPWKTSVLPKELPLTAPGSFFYLLDRDSLGSFTGIKQIDDDMFSPWNTHLTSWQRLSKPHSCIMRGTWTHPEFPSLRRQITYIGDSERKPVSDILYQYYLKDSEGFKCTMNKRKRMAETDLNLGNTSKQRTEENQEGTGPESSGAKRCKIEDDAANVTLAPNRNTAASPPPSMATPPQPALIENDGHPAPSLDAHSFNVVGHLLKVIAEQKKRYGLLEESDDMIPVHNRLMELNKVRDEVKELMDKVANIIRNGQ